MKLNEIHDMLNQNIIEYPDGIYTIRNTDYSIPTLPDLLDVIICDNIIIYGFTVKILDDVYYLKVNSIDIFQFKNSLKYDDYHHIIKCCYKCNYSSDDITAVISLNLKPIYNYNCIFRNSSKLYNLDELIENIVKTMGIKNFNKNTKPLIIPVTSQITHNGFLPPTVSAFNVPDIDIEGKEIQ